MVTSVEHEGTAIDFNITAWNRDVRKESDIDCTNG